MIDSIYGGVWKQFRADVILDSFDIRSLISIQCLISSRPLVDILIYKYISIYIYIYIYEDVYICAGNVYNGEMTLDFPGGLSPALERTLSPFSPVSLAGSRCPRPTPGVESSHARGLACRSGTRRTNETTGLARQQPKGKPER